MLRGSGPDTLFKIFLQPPAKRNAHAATQRVVAPTSPPPSGVYVQTDIGLLPIRRAVGGAKYLPKAS